jgi:tRNA-specific 2-thiouridylase
MAKNEVYVTTDLDDKRLWSNQIGLTSAHWINEVPAEAQNLMVRTRHRAKLLKVNKLSKATGGVWLAELVDEVRALTPGQSAVFYDKDLCLGGGVVTC